MAKTHQSELPDAALAHVNDMLAYAARLHGAAMSNLAQGENAPRARLREAIALLDQAEILAVDAASYAHDERLERAINLLRTQQAQLKEAGARLDGPLPHAAYWARPWPWISLAAVMFALWQLLA